MYLFIFIQKFGVRKKIILLLYSKDALNWSKVALHCYKKIYFK